MKKNHCVFYRSNLKYDGRICSLIRTLALSFSNEKVFLYEYTIQKESYIGFPSNVVIIKSKLFFNQFRKSRIIQILKNFEYALKSLIFLIKKNPKTIQVHNEIVVLGPLLYKTLFKKNVLVYNDEELYHPKDKNIPNSLYKMEYLLISQSDLVIIPNSYRRKALQYIHKNKIKKSILVDNYVFEPKKKIISKSLLYQINELKKKKKKILLHQGVLTKDRGRELLCSIASYLPEEWIMLFIGISEDMFKDFTNNLGANYNSKLDNFGFVDYFELDAFYQYIDACVIFYNSNTFNNKYCAPNRLYSPVNNGKPIIVNKDNVILNNFVNQFKNGLSIEDGGKVSMFFESFDEYLHNAKKLTGKYEYNSIIPQLKDFYSHL